LKRSLPPSWTWAKGEDLFSFIRGVSYDKASATSQSGEGRVAILRAGNLQNGCIEFEDLVFVPQNYVRDEQLLKRGDLVIAMSSGSASVVGKVAVVQDDYSDFSFGAFCGLLRPVTADLGNWLAHYFQTKSYRNEISRAAAGININNIKREHLLEPDIPLAPLNELRCIVVKLEELLGRVEACQKRLEQVPRLLKQFRQSVLAAACSGQLSAEWRGEKQNTEDANELPEGWSVKTIGELETFIGSGITPKGGSTVYVNEGVPFIRSQNVYASGLVLDDVAYVTEAMHAAMSRTHLKPSDILLNITGASIGRSSVVPETFTIGNVNQHVCIIRLQPEALPKYVSMFLNSPAGQDLIFGTQVGMTRQGLNYNQLRAFSIPLPPPEEQQEIISRVEALITFASTIEDHLRKAQKQLDKLPQSILSKAFRGELVPQDPDDEPASVLLERIKAEKSKTEKPEKKNKRPLVPKSKTAAGRSVLF